MINQHKYPLFWLSYLVIVILSIIAAIYSGLMQLIWKYDITYLSSVIFCIWMITELIGGYQIIKLDQQTFNSINHKEISTTIASIFAQHRFVNFMSEIIVTLGIFGTVIGVILALMPFLSLTNFDPVKLQPQLLQMFSGIAVAFFPTAISILIKVFLDFNTRIHEMAVLHLNSILEEK